MKVLVTGGCGFIGSHLVDDLVKRGYKVVIVDNLSTGRKENLNPKAKFFKLDIQDKRIESVFRKERFDYVFHLAAQINVRRSVANPILDAKVNVLGSLNLLENARKFKIKKFIFASTGGAIYGDTEKIPTPESYLEKPISPYGIAKLTVEKYLYYYQKEFGLDYVVLRLANVYGPRQNAEGEAGVVAIFISRILKGQQSVINGTGKQTRDYIYVTDVIRAMILALRSLAPLKKKGGLYNVGTAKEINVIQIFNKIIQIGQFNAKEKHGPALKGEQERSCLDCSKIKKEWGFEPFYNLEEGLKETILWFKNQRSCEY